ncbi:hypothetical protein K493DRAFT_314042 [Basidiobolus meristosporus CBS 931.73]|uniref:G-protein coupled receptors family 2 profile 2 domain-containing protein n=1 Tax=Basidiobolus meristosporus CBS 931.73 TaxID=1314790 RepID=A0A1Y1YHM5_9FUNG|nr:hypothetical protein K493DRAFT_314042 [Basidiobolus meristosporus CBS 931.73]|eukprot:ORX97522.1 hypothetical protein K493DRAFT_314042 [Basidiobolus meristosporus CBS 931.73]
MAGEETINYDSALSKDIDAKAIAVLVLSSLSLVGAVVVIITILCIRSWKAEVGSRVSLTLTFWIACSDLLFSIFSLLLASTLVSNATCSFFLWGYVEFTLLPIFLTVAIGFNLQMVFVHGSKNLLRYQRLYVPVCVAVSLLISLLPVVAKQFQLDPAVNSCWYQSTYTTGTILWEVLTFYGWILLGVAYCVLAVIMVAWKLHVNNKRLANNTGPIHSHLIGHKTSRAVRRIALYPLIPIVTQTFNFVSEFDTFVSRDMNSTLYVLSAVTPVCMGLLNAVVFMFDPAFQLFWRELRSGKSFSLSITTTSGYQENKSGVSLPSPKTINVKYQKFTDEPEETREKYLGTHHHHTESTGSDIDRESITVTIPLQTLAQSQSQSRSSKGDLGRDVWERNSVQLLAGQGSAPSTLLPGPNRKAHKSNFIKYL